MVSLSQDAAYDVLLEICINNCDGLKSVADKLITWHHSSVDTTEWEYMPPVEGRASSGIFITRSVTNTLLEDIYPFINFSLRWVIVQSEVWQVIKNLLYLLVSRLL